MISGLATPYALAIDAITGQLYWADDGTNKIQRANSDGSGLTDLVSMASTSSDIRAMALDLVHQKMYWADIGLGVIRRAALDGSQVEDLVTTGLGDMRGLALDVYGGNLYWMNSLSDSDTRLQRSNLDGTDIQTLLTVPLAGGLALDAGASLLYFTNPADHHIYRVQTDGSGLLALAYSGAATPAGIALASNTSPVPEPSTLYLLGTGGLGLVATLRWRKRG